MTKTIKQARPVPAALWGTQNPGHRFGALLEQLACSGLSWEQSVQEQYTVIRIFGTPLPPAPVPDKGKS